MRIDLAAILFIIFVVAQFLCARKATRKIIKFIPMLLSVTAGLATLGIIYIGKNAFGVLFFIPVGISLIGSIVGLLIASIITKRKKDV